MKKCISLMLSLVMVTVFSFGSLTGVYAAENTAPAEAAGGSIEEQLAQDEAPRAEDQLIVFYKDDLSNKAIKSDVSDIGTVSKVTKVEDQKMALVDLDTDEGTAAQVLEDSDKVLYVQPNYRYEIPQDAAQAAPAASDGSDLTGDMQAAEEGQTPDPYLDPANASSYQYYMKNTNAEEAWDMIEGTEGHGQTIVGVVDTGVDSRHADLKNNLITLDDKGKYRGYANGVARDLYDDTDSHGTHVSGIIGAEYGNGLGGSGVASGHNNDLVKVITTSTATDDGSLFSYDICRSIDYNIEHGARVISMSFGGYGEDVMMETCIRQHYEEDGTVFVAASGNDGSNAFTTPCDYATVISVNASAARMEAAYYSDYGKNKDIAAPGSNIMSTIPGDMYAAMSGTSMATPVVSGICGLILDINPDLTPAQVKNIICGTTVEAQKGEGFTSDLAYGNIDALAAVKAAAKASESVGVQSVSIKEGEADGSVNLSIGESTQLTAHVLPAECLKPVTWASSNSSVATVDEDGRVTPVSPGKTTITATCGGQTGDMMVKVKKGNVAESVKIKNAEELTEIKCAENDYDYGTLSYVTEPAGSAAPACSFESSDNDVLFVDGTGYYLARKAGAATISLKDKAGNVLDKIDVQVKNPVTNIKFTQKVKKLAVGKTYQFAAQVMDEDPYKPEITWSVSNKKGSIDPETGLFTADKKGKCYVIATTEGGAYSAVKVTLGKKAAKKSKNTKGSGNKAMVVYGKVTKLPSYFADSNSPRIQDSAEETVAQYMEEILMSEITDTERTITEDYYAPDVVAAINQSYADIMAYVGEHPDELELLGFFIVVSPELYSQIESFTMLLSLSKAEYSGPEDVKSLKKIINKKYNRFIKKKANKKDYTDWYWDKVVAVKDEAKALNSEVKDLETFIAATKADLYTAFAEPVGWWTSYSYADYFTGYLQECSYESTQIVTKKHMAKAIAAGQDILDTLATRGDAVKFTPSEAVEKQMQSFTKKAKKQVDLNCIAALHKPITDAWFAEYDEYIKTMEESGDLMTSADTARWIDKMYKHVFTYDHAKYTAKAYQNLWSTYYDYSSRMESCVTITKAEKLWNKYVTAMDKVKKK